MSMKSLYNWFTSMPSQQFTLGEAINGSGFATYELSKGERAIERSLTAGGLVAAGIVLATGGLAALPLALDLAVGGKVLGLISATFAKVATRGVQFANAEPDLVPIPVRSNHNGAQYRR